MFVNPDIQQSGTVSGRVTTASDNEVITMQDGGGNDVTAVNLAIKAITALRLRINDELNWHQFGAGDTFNYGNLVITKLTIETSGSQIDYKGGHV